MKVKVLHAKRRVIPMKVDTREHCRTTILTLQSLRIPPRQLVSSRRAVRKVKFDQISARRRILEHSSSQSVFIQHPKNFWKRYMRCRVLYIALYELEAMLSMRGAKKANLDQEQTWNTYARKLIEAVFQKNANLDAEISDCPAV